MNDLWETLHLFLKRTLLALGLLSLCRVLFFVFNPGHFTGVGFDVFIYGIRFDLSAYFYWYLPFIIVSIIGIWTNPNWLRLAKEYLFYLSSALVALFNCIDIPYFRFTYKRSTADLFTTVSTGDDVLTLIPKFFTDFWPVVIIYLAMIWGISWAYKKLKIYRPPRVVQEKLIIAKSVTTVLVISLMIIIGRGGFQLIPLNIIDASKKVKAQNVPLVLNTPFTIVRTISQKGLKPLNDFTQVEVDQSFPVKKQFQGEREFKKKNVVIFILESFSNEFIFPDVGEPNLAPFLSSLLIKSYTFDHCYANGKKSIEGIPSILSSIPTLMNGAMINSRYAGNRLGSIASILKENGYHSSFYHGGKNGTMSFDSYCAAAGFDKYVGMNEYPTPADYDGAWGIPDEPFLQFYADELTKMDQPFVSSVFTLSSHHPFIIPEQYQQMFNKGKTDLENSISYTDYSIEQFFKKLEGSPIMENTIFVFTSDHTSTSRKKYYRNSLGNFRIPLIIYSPGDSLIGIDHTVTQQLDIMPSILDLLGYQQPFFAFGQSKFSANNGFSFQVINEVDQFIKDGYLLQSRGDEALGLYQIQTDSLLTENLIHKELEITQKHLTLSRQFRQQYNNRVINNELHLE